LDASSTKEKRPDEARRRFLKTTVVASAIIAIGGVSAVAKSLTVPAQTSAAPTSFPKIQLFDSNNNIITVNSLQMNQLILFYYPLNDEPNILVKLGVQAENGVGPDGDIVAFSDICQHLGCNPGFVAKGQSPPCNSSYQAPGPVMYCCCHGSIYDLERNAEVIGGPAPRPVPRVILEVDEVGNIYAVGMSPPTIYGHHTGSEEVTYDLQGGTLVE
jgi:arsenite oxidase small subunit